MTYENMTKHNNGKMKMPLLYLIILMFGIVSCVGQVQDNSPCDIYKEKWIIILATGRSGSTTLMSMVNLLPGVNISGEHDGLMHSFKDLRDHLRRLKRMRGIAWAHTLWASEDNQVYCMAQQWVKSDSSNRNRSDDLIRHGFKEIRYNDVDILEFLEDAFPNAQFIISYRRDIAAQLSSTSKAFSQPFGTNDLNKHTKTLLDWAKERPDNKTYDMPLEKFSLETFSNLYQWLGFNCTATAMEHDNADKGYRRVSKGSVTCF